MTRSIARSEATVNNLWRPGNGRRFSLTDSGRMILGAERESETRLMVQPRIISDLIVPRFALESRRIGETIAL